MKRLIETTELFIDAPSPPDGGLAKGVVIQQRCRTERRGGFTSLATRIAFEEIKVAINEIGLRVLHESLHGCAHGIGFVKIVGAQIGEDFASGHGESLVDRVRLTRVLLRYPTDIASGRQQIDCAVRRSAVDDDMFHLVRRCLCCGTAHRVETLAEVSGLIEGRGDDRKFHDAVGLKIFLKMRS